MKALRRLAFAAAVVTSLPVSAAYSELVVFGDSLSDNGNFLALTGGQFPSPAFGYATGRFSNGPVAVEYLATSLGLTLHNFAVGGARTGTPFGGGSDNYVDASGQGTELGLPSDYFNGTGVLAQISQRVAAGPLDPNALYLVWAGPNDYFLPESLLSPDTVPNAIGHLGSGLTQLYNAGARNFLVPNMANLGLTPAMQAEGPLAAGLATLRSAEHNTALAQLLGTLDQTLTLADFRTVDVFDLLNSAALNPDQYGLTNTDTPCQTTPGCAGDPAGYLFWDGVHITTAGHQVVGAAFAAALVPEADGWAMLVAGLGVLGVARRLQAAGARRDRLAGCHAAQEGT